MANALIALGANLGERAETLDAAIASLQAAPEVHAVHPSRWIETAPVGGPVGQGGFLNGAAVVETTRSPESLHALLHEIEAQVGRVRRIRWDARVLDLDLLLYDAAVFQDGAVIQTEQLTLPHPRMAFRRFVLEPAAEVAGPMVHPTIGLSVSELLENLNRKPHRIVIIGDCEKLRTDVLARIGSELAEQVELMLAADAAELEDAPTLWVTVSPADVDIGPWQRPRLDVSAYDHEQAVVELTAAIEAMQ